MSDDWCPENDGAYRMELAARERDTITTLRERLEQAERERDNYNAMYEQALITATQSRKYGFRAGIEAAYEVSGEYHQITHVREAIRALDAQGDG